MGGQGNSKRAGVHAIGVSYTGSGERTVPCGQTDGQGGEQGKGRRTCNFCEWGGVLESREPRKFNENRKYTELTT